MEKEFQIVEYQGTPKKPNPRRVYFCRCGVKVECDANKNKNRTVYTYLHSKMSTHIHDCPLDKNRADVVKFEDEQLQLWQD